MKASFNAIWPTLLILVSGSQSWSDRVVVFAEAKAPHLVSPWAPLASLWRGVGVKRLAVHVPAQREPASFTASSPQ